MELMYAYKDSVEAANARLVELEKSRVEACQSVVTNVGAEGTLICLHAFQQTRDWKSGVIEYALTPLLVYELSVKQLSSIKIYPITDKVVAWSSLEYNRLSYYGYYLNTVDVSASGMKGKLNAIAKEGL
nr:hypothetical transcript [Hymenolepis microstoma]